MITRRTLHALLDFFPWKFWKCPCRTGHKNSLRYFRKPHGQQSAFKMVVDWSGWHLNRFSRLWISESESIVLVNPNSKNLLKRVLHSRKKKKAKREIIFIKCHFCNPRGNWQIMFRIHFSNAKPCLHFRANLRDI